MTKALLVLQNHFIVDNKFKKSNFNQGEIFNISDDRPSSSEDIIMHGVKLLNVKKLNIFLLHAFTKTRTSYKR